MAKKPKGYGKRGRPTTKEIRTLQKAKALIDNGLDPIKAYQATHPKSKHTSTIVNCYRTMTPEVLEAVKRLLAADKLAETTKANLEKLLHVVIAKYIEGEESGANYINAIKILTQLVPEFKERHALEGALPSSTEEVDEQLKALGLDTDKLFKRGGTEDGPTEESSNN